MMLASLLPFVVLVVVWASLARYTDRKGRERRSDGIDVAVPATAARTHSYRDERFATVAGWYRRTALVPLAVIGVMIGLADRRARDSILLVALALFVFVLAAIAGRRACIEIRLSEDGMCELVTKRNVIRLRVGQIRSVRCRSAGDGDSESYRIEFDGGKIDVAEQMTDFHDFLLRLRELNPAVDLSGFREPAWPGLTMPIGSRESAGGRRAAHVAFAVVVVGFLVWLTVDTLH